MYSWLLIRNDLFDSYNSIEINKEANVFMWSSYVIHLNDLQIEASFI